MCLVFKHNQSKSTHILHLSLIISFLSHFIYCIYFYFFPKSYFVIRFHSPTLSAYWSNLGTHLVRRKFLSRHKSLNLFEDFVGPISRSTRLSFHTTTLKCIYVYAWEVWSKGEARPLPSLAPSLFVPRVVIFGIYVVGLGLLIWKGGLKYLWTLC